MSTVLCMGIRANAIWNVEGIVSVDISVSVSTGISVRVGTSMNSGVSDGASVVGDFCKRSRAAASTIKETGMDTSANGIVDVRKNVSVDVSVEKIPSVSVALCARLSVYVSVSVSAGLEMVRKKV